MGIHRHTLICVSYEFQMSYKLYSTIKRVVSRQTWLIVGVYMLYIPFRRCDSCNIGTHSLMYTLCLYTMFL